MKARRTLCGGVVLACMLIGSVIAWSDEQIDFDKARKLFQRQQSGEKLSKEEADYLEAAKAARGKAQNQRPQQQQAPAGGLTPRETT